MSHTLQQLAYNDWHREDAKHDVFPEDYEFTERKPRLWKCYCGWEGTPERTHNSGGVINFKYCPECRSHLHAPENVKENEQ